MNATDQTEILELPCYVAGEEVGSEPLEVIYPYNGELAGRVRMVDGSGLERALSASASCTAASAPRALKLRTRFLPQAPQPTTAMRGLAAAGLPLLTGIYAPMPRSRVVDIKIFSQAHDTRLRGAVNDAH